MKTILISLFCVLTIPVIAQQDHKKIRQGNRLFASEKFDESEISYRKAIELDGRNQIAGFNLGDALYRQEKFEEAGRQFQSSAAQNPTRENQSKALHNLGNSLLSAGKIDESIDAYKEALRKNPNDFETKYNLAYAQHLKQNPQQQQKQDQQNQDNQENKEDQQQEQQQQQQEQQQQESKQQEQQQGQPQQISREDAQRLLAALASDEKQVQEKVKKEKARAKRVRTLKDW